MNRIMHALAMAASDAPSVGRTIKKWGLLGTWASDCKAPPGRTNVFSTYVRRGGRAFLERAFGEASNDSSEVIAATVIASDMLEFTVDFRAIRQVRTIGVQRDRPTRLRTIWNHGADGRFSVRSGLLLADGTPMSWRNRCR